MARFCSTFAGN